MKMISILAALLFTSAAFAEKVQLDLDKSVIKWKGGKEFTSDFHTGTVKLASGFVDIEKGEVKSAELTIDMNSIANTDLADKAYKAKLEGHLKSADFFDTASHQTAKFVSKKITKNSDKSMIEGDLTVKNKTNSQRVNVTIVKEGKVYTAKGTTDFDRSKYDVKYNSTSYFPDLIKSGKDKVIKNNIELEFDLKTVATNQ